MDNNIFFRANKPWTPDEDLQLRILYNVKKMNVKDISKIHFRTINAIIARLRKLNIIDNYKYCNGYDETITIKKNIKFNKENIKLYRENKCFMDKLEKINEKIFTSTNKINNSLNNIHKKLLDYELLDKKYRELLIENKILNENNKDISENDDYGIISINNKDYLLVKNEVYKIKNIKGELYGYYDSNRNKIKKI